MAELPSGTVTFLFTDLEGSTRLWEEHPDAMRPALARHDELIRTAVEECGGTVVKTTGDGVHAVFDTAEMGVSAAVAAQRRLVDQVWEAPTDLRVRMGLHTGGAELRDGDYYGSAVNRAARLMSAAHGGQIVCSQATADLARDALAEDVVLVDLGDHRLRDLARPERVFQVNGTGLSGEFGALRSLDAFPGNLPLQLSSFVGREREMARVAATLDESRVVTLTGVGGVGKTRLALQVAAELLPQFRFGAWLCELAAVRTAESVVESVATVFDVTARTGESIESALVEFLKSKALLIVLDNCEHVLEEAVSLVEQLEQACPDVRVLATSREGLGVDGERILAVPSLASPPADASSDEVTSAPAVELFAERARALKSDFQVTEDNFEAIGAICRRLDGMPLAIELAAARIPAMNPGELLARLDQRFQLLAGGGRGRVERHQTLRAVIDWSFELLDPGEQQLLVRMTVFSGGWTLDAAEAVCATDRVAASAVFALTERLVARSLVVAEDLGFQTRYRLLETIRQYGEERLVGTEDLIELRRRHSAHYLEYAAELASNLFGPDQIASGRRLLAERENILAAFAMTLETGDVDAAMQWIRTLPGPAAQIGYQVRLPIAAVLSLDGAGQHSGYAFAVVTAMFHAAISGDRERCDGHTKELAALERERGEPFGGEVALFASASGMSLAFRASGDWERAAEFGDRGLEIQGELVAAGVHTAGMRASWMASAASLHATAGDHEGAVILATEALEASRRFGMPTAIAVSLSALAGGLAESEPDRARAYLLESMELRARLDYETANEVAIAVLVAARLRDWEIARELCAQAIPLLHLTGDQPQLAGILNVSARALVDHDPETSAIVQGGARQLALVGLPATDSLPAPGPGGAFSLIGALRHETTGIIDAALGKERRRQLRSRGESLNVDDTVALAVDALRRARRADAST